MVIAAIIHEKEMLGYNGVDILFKVLFMWDLGEVERKVEFDSKNISGI